MSKSTLLAGVICLVASLPLNAAEPDGVWSFAALLREAESTHPSMVARHRIEEAAQAEVAAAGWQRYPTPGIEASRDNDGEHKTVLFLQQPLWTGGRISAGIDAAEARHAAAHEEVSTTRRTLLLRLVDAWVEARQRQAQQEIVYRNVQQHERLLAMIERRVQRQVSPMVDQELARSRLYQAANELSHVVQALAVTLARLSELVGQPVARVALSATEEPDLSDLPEGRAQALADAVDASPVVKGLSFEYAAAQADVSSERAAYSPRLALRMEWQNEKNTGSDRRALLVLESQLGAGLSSGAKVAAAASRRDALDADRQAALRLLEIDVSEAWLQLTASRLRLDNSQINQASAETVFESWARQYSVGQKSWQDVLNAVRESSSAALAVEDARAELVRAGLRLQILTGRL